MTIDIYAENAPGWILHGVLLACEGGVFSARGECFLHEGCFLRMQKLLRGGFRTGVILAPYTGCCHGDEGGGGGEGGGTCEKSGVCTWSCPTLSVVRTHLTDYK